MYSPELYSIFGKKISFFVVRLKGHKTLMVTGVGVDVCNHICQNCYPECLTAFSLLILMLSMDPFYSLYASFKILSEFVKTVW